MKKILIILLTLFPLLSMGQDMSVKKFEMVANDLTARQNERLDGNNTPCALVKVELASEGAEFEGNVVGNVAYKAGVYNVYMTEGSKNLKILHPSFHPITVWFGRENSSVSMLQPKMTYVLSINIPFKGQEADAGGNFFSFNIQPSSATLKVDGQFYQRDEGGSFSGFLNYGNYNYIIESPGYDTETGTFTIKKGDPLVQTFSLISQMATINIDCPDKKADIYINNQLKGTGTYSGSIVPGTYLVEAKREGYRKISKNVKIGLKEKKVLHLETLEAIYGKLKANYLPAGATVMLDGEKIGTTPQIINNVICGTHTVIIKKEGFETKKSTITIEENQIADLSGSLRKILPGEAIIGSVAPNSLVAYYPFNGDVKDASGKGNNGKAHNVSYTTDRFGNEKSAAVFNGFENPSYVDVENSQSLKFEKECTISLFLKMIGWDGQDGWGKHVGRGWQTIFAKWSDRAGITWSVNGDNSELDSYIGAMYTSWVENDKKNKPKGNFLNQWVHMALVIKEDGYSIYLNGEKITWNNKQTNLGNMNKNNMRIGYGGNGWYPLKAAIDELRIYNKALTLDEIKELGNDE